MDADVIIIGGGIAGLSAASALGASRRVVVLEREEFAGYHATGRSAALFAIGVGKGLTRALTRASRSFMESPPAGFAEHPILSPRGFLNFARPQHIEPLRAYFERLRPFNPSAMWLDETALREKLPLVRPGAHLMRGVRVGIPIGLVFGAAYAAQTFGLTVTSPARSAFITALSVALVPFFGYAVSRVRPGWPQLFALLLTVPGLWFLTWPVDQIGSWNRGDSWTTVCAVLFEQVAPRDAVSELLARDPKPEA